MNLLLWSPHIVFLSTFAALIAVLWVLRFFKRGRRSPLTRHLLRSPGETLRHKIDDLSDDLNALILSSFTLPLLFYAMYLAYALSGKASTAVVILFSITVLVMFFYIIYKMTKISKERNMLRLGLDCELAVGQELNQMMREGCFVYHDFPAEGFNIDHVVVGPMGVFAVETKGRSKSDKKGGPKEATVTYDGEKLNFPGWTEKEPLEQAKRQARWLSQWLSSAVGESVSARPVLVLPGWFIDRKKPSDMLIFNGKNPEMLLNWRRDDVLSPEMIKRIAHQIEQRCRDVEPVAYSKKAQGK